MSISINNGRSIQGNHASPGGDADALTTDEVARLVAHLQAGTLPPALARFIQAAHAHAETTLKQPVSHATLVRWIPRDTIHALGGASAAQPHAAPVVIEPEAASETPGPEAAAQSVAPSVTGSTLPSSRLPVIPLAKAERQVQAKRMAYAAAEYMEGLQEQLQAKDQKQHQQSARRRQMVANRQTRELHAAFAQAYLLALTPASSDRVALGITSEMRNNAQGGHLLRSSRSLATPGPESTLHETALRAQTPPTRQPPLFADAT